MSDHHRQKLSTEELLASLPDDPLVEVLLRPVGAADGLRRRLAELADSGSVSYNELPLANMIAVRAPRAVVRELAARDDVASVGANPAFGTDDAV